MLTRRGQGGFNGKETVFQKVIRTGHIFHITCAGGICPCLAGVWLVALETLRSCRIVVLVSGRSYQSLVPSPLQYSSDPNWTRSRRHLSLPANKTTFIEFLQFIHKRKRMMR